MNRMYREPSGVENILCPKIFKFFLITAFFHVPWLLHQSERKKIFGILTARYMTLECYVGYETLSFRMRAQIAASPPPCTEIPFQRTGAAV